MNTRTLCLIIGILCCVSRLTAQDIRATCDDGRTVILRSNGTWFFVNQSPHVDGSAVLFNGKVANLLKTGTWSMTDAKRAVPAAVYPAPADPARSGRSLQTSGHPFLARNVEKIIAADGSTVDLRRITNQKIVLLYFSAGWCSPCRQFTPKLVQFYNQYGGGDKFEILFFSDDETEEAMMNYMLGEQMPWPAAAWGIRGKSVVKDKHHGDGIPCLVMLDEQDNVISDTNVDGVRRGPYAVIKDLAARLGLQ